MRPIAPSCSNLSWWQAGSPLRDCSVKSVAYPVALCFNQVWAFMWISWVLWKQLTLNFLLMITGAVWSLGFEYNYCLFCVVAILIQLLFPGRCFIKDWGDTGKICDLRCFTTNRLNSFWWNPPVGSEIILIFIFKFFCLFLGTLCKTPLFLLLLEGPSEGRDSSLAPGQMGKPVTLESWGQPVSSLDWLAGLASRPVLFQKFWLN